MIANDSAFCGVANLVHTEGVTGSIPVASTIFSKCEWAPM